MKKVKVKEPLKYTAPLDWEDEEDYIGSVHSKVITGVSHISFDVKMKYKDVNKRTGIYYEPFAYITEHYREETGPKFDTREEAKQWCQDIWDEIVQDILVSRKKRL